jgi:phage-related protein
MTAIKVKQGGLRDGFQTLVLKGMYGFDALKKAALGVGPAIIGAIGPALATAGTAIMEFFAALTPVGWIIIAVAAITAFFVWFFTQTDIGKKIWSDMTKFFAEAWANTVKFFQDAWTNAMAFFKPAIDGIAAIFKTGFDIMKGIVDVFVAILTIAFIGIGWAVQVVWDSIKIGFKAVSDFLAPIVKGIAAFFKPIFKSIGDFIATIWNGIKVGFAKFIQFISPALAPILGFFKVVFNGVTGYFKGVMNGLIGMAEGFVNFFVDGLNTIIIGINKIKMDIPPLLQGLFNGAKSISFHIDPVSKIKLPRLAKGGTVMPSPGGSLVNIAEAGRPERVEPLDSNGLSARDKAMIDLLSKGKSSNATPIQMNIYPSAGMDEKDLAAIVSRTLAFELRKGGI